MRVRQLIIAAAAAIALSANTASAILFQDTQDYTVIGSVLDPTLGPVPVYGPGIHLDATDPLNDTFRDTFDIANGTPDPGYPNYLYPWPLDISGYTLNDTILSAYATFSFSTGGAAIQQVEVDVGVPKEFFGVGTPDITFYSNLGASIILQIQATGKLGFLVTATDGDMYLTGATLYVDTAQGYNIPDGGVTLAMLGLGCLGLVGVGRKFAI